MTGPYPILGMRKRARTNGAPYMVAVVDAELVIPAGAEIHLRRLHDGRLSSPEFALQVVPPKCAPTRKQLGDAAADRLDGSAIREQAPGERSPNATHPQTTSDPARSPIGGGPARPAGPQCRPGLSL